MRLLLVCLIVLHLHLIGMLTLTEERDISHAPDPPAREISHKELIALVNANQRELDRLTADYARLADEIRSFAFKGEIDTSDPIRQRASLSDPPVRFVQFAAFDTEDTVIDLRDSRPPQNLLREEGNRSPDEYWDALQRYTQADSLFALHPERREAFLKQGAALIQHLEQAESNLRIDAEAAQFLEARVSEEGVSAIERLYDTKKRMAGYITESKQYRRELETMLSDGTPVLLPKITHQLPRIEGRTEEFYHPALASHQVICDERNNFLVSIRFVHKTDIGGFPKVQNVEDTLNLRTMQSINGGSYPEYFTQEIYSLIRKAFRDGCLEFEGLTRKAEQLHTFLQLLG